MFRPVHCGDAYAELDALCAHHGWTLSVGLAMGQFSLRVERPCEPVWSASFTAGHENDAAADLLKRLDRLAA